MFDGSSKANIFAVTAFDGNPLPCVQEVRVSSREELLFMEQSLLGYIAELEQWLLANEVNCPPERKGDNTAALSVDGHWRSLPVEMELEKPLPRPAKLIEKLTSWLQRKINLSRPPLCGPAKLEMGRFLVWTAPPLSPGYGASASRSYLRRLPAQGSFVHWIATGGLDITQQDQVLVFDLYKGWEQDIGLLRGVLRPWHRLAVKGTSKLLKNWRLEGELDGGFSLYADPPEDWLLERDWRQVEKNWPRISVIIPSYNQARFVRQALDSIFAQGYPNLETIVLDPGSTDGTREILQEYEDKITHLILEPDKGQSDALQRGLNMADGDILTWLCTDDMLEPDSLFRAAEAFLFYGSDVVAGGCRRIDEDGLEFETHFSAMPFNQTVRLDTLGMMDMLHGWQAGHFFYQPEVFFTKNIWLRAGGFFHQSAYYGMDYDMWVRMALAGGTGVQIFNYLAASRMQEDQKTKLGEKPIYLWQQLNYLKHYRNILHKALELW